MHSYDVTIVIWTMLKKISVQAQKNITRTPQTRTLLRRVEKKLALSNNADD